MALIELEAALDICKKYQNHGDDMCAFCCDGAAFSIGDEIKKLPATDTIYAADTNKIANILNDIINELCLKCGKYSYEFAGACDGCKWHEYTGGVQ